MESTRADPRIGLVLNGRYRITAPIGEGGMGLVYRGERLQLMRPVAIKFLQTPYADSAKFVARFEREARAMSMLSHPYCVAVLDFGVHEAPYIIMDYVTGSTLRQALDEARFSPQRALHITRQVLIGLAHAHGQGVIHRDIKPGNIMLGEATGLSDHVRIFDFGLAKLHDPELHGEASIAAIVGTPAYMAPEQARADKVDGRADLYAAGVVLFEMLTGKKPFEADTAYQLLCLQRDKAPPLLRELAPGLSVELESVLSKALEKDPAARYQTAAEFGAALESTPEWATVGAALASATADAALANTQLVASSRTGRNVPGARAAPSSGRSWAGLALLLLAVFGFAWWKLHIEPGDATGATTPTQVIEAAKSWAAHVVEKGQGARESAFPSAEAPAGPEEPSAPAPAAAHADPTTADPTTADPGLVMDEPSAPVPSTSDGLVEGAEDSDDPGELSEAALAAADEALNDREEREVVLAVSSEPQRRPIESVAGVRALMAKGQTDAAIRGIQQLRRKRPHDAQLPFLLGNLYFDKGWWLDGLVKYRETIGLASGYRKNARVQRDAIRALGQDRAYARARALLVRDIGRPALAALKRAARADASSALRRRASSVAKQIAR